MRDHTSIPTTGRQIRSPFPPSPPPHRSPIPFAAVRAPLMPASKPPVVNWVNMRPLDWRLALRDSGLMPIWRLLACSSPPPKSAVCFWPPVKDELLLSMRFQSLVLTSMTPLPYQEAESDQNVATRAAAHAACLRRCSDWTLCLQAEHMLCLIHIICQRIGTNDIGTD